VQNYEATLECFVKAACYPCSYANSTVHNNYMYIAIFDKEIYLQIVQLCDKWKNLSIYQT